MEYVKVEFTIKARSGRIVQREDVQFPKGTSEQDIQNAYDNWKERIYEDFEHNWRYINPDGSTCIPPIKIP
ncbi:hypothetical protein [Paenibacillus chitinolyticus]|uniref:hypothetical protein n=1 Tax=Paenibacillus chitinolyticus TaxID=79263 RepID=UPI001C43E2B8|nr:hypothetical protein [Paenibacillus chitinolyticus]MBV6717240.1 hypothetical protein [Paenibacillus chitinolyticus]